MRKEIWLAVLCVICNSVPGYGVSVARLSVCTGSLDTQVLVSDYEGKKLGYDYLNKAIVKEIPAGIYGNNDFDTGKFLDISLPKEGLYTLEAIAQKEGLYYVEIITMDEDAQTDNKTLYSLLSAGETDRFEIEYTPNAGEKSVMRKVVDAGVLERELKLAVKLKLINDKKLERKLKQQVQAYRKNRDTKAIEEFIRIAEQKHNEIKNAEPSVPERDLQKYPGGGGYERYAKDFAKERGEHAKWEERIKALEALIHDAGELRKK